MGNLFFIFISLLLHHHHHHHTVVAQPLSTDSRWIVNTAGIRVKLSCVNWVTHLEAVVAEGLSKQPVDVISKRILEMGFNCVRLTWPLYLAIDDNLANKTSVRQSFMNLGLMDSIAGFQANNPQLIDVSLMEAYKAVVQSLANQNVMVILDNHLSKPGWCCSNSDGNGFFGDKYFDPDQWINGLTHMATIFKGFSNVVGMSLRNELRGNRQNVNDWYRYMQKGAEAVHSANPDVLVILSGLNYDNDLSFLGNRQVNLSFTGKLVYELHWYGFTDGNAWASGNPNQVCGKVTGNIMNKAGFLLEKGYPLFFSEFGIDQRGTNVNDNRYFNCFAGFAAEHDLDWALWTLTGSYYLRENVVGLEEFYGMFTWNWCGIRNSSFLQRISPLQSPFRGPGKRESSPHKVIFHPLTGLCIQAKTILDPLRLGPCDASDAWDYSPEKVLTLKGTYFCLQADDKEGKAVKLSMLCSRNTAKWDQISDSKMHLSTKIGNGDSVCLDVDTATNTIVTSRCDCLSGDNRCDPASQWFKIVDSTVATTTSSKYFPFINSLFNLLGRLF